MRQYNPDPAAKKARYITSIIYILVLTFIVGGSYINQQTADQVKPAEEEINWTRP